MSSDERQPADDVRKGRCDPPVRTGAPDQRLPADYERAIEVAAKEVLLAGYNLNPADPKEAVILASLAVIAYERCLRRRGIRVLAWAAADPTCPQCGLDEDCVCDRPCKWCNDEGIVHTHDGEIIGPCECTLAAGRIDADG